MGLSFKSAVNSLALLVTALLCHAFAGGTFISARHLEIESGAILVALMLVRAGLLTGPKLALVILFTQSVSHLALGGMSGSSLTMTLTHIVGGFFAYGFVSHSEQIWDRLRTLLNSLLPFLGASTYKVDLTYVALPSIEYSFSQKIFIENTSLGRGPPETDKQTQEGSNLLCLA